MTRSPFPPPSDRSVPLVYGSRSEPRIGVRAANGNTLTVPMSTAVAFVATSGAVLIGPLSPSQQDDFDRATAHYFSIFAAQRNLIR